MISGATVVSQNDKLIYSVVGNTNPAVVTTTINNERLTLQATGVKGTSTITVRATDQKFGFSVDTSFNVTVS